MRWPWRRNNESDLERELRSDLELETSEQQDNGLSPEESRYAARRALGNLALVKEDVGAVSGWTWVESCVQDLRFGSRILAKSPGITAAVVLSLALGLGATTAFFSLLNALLFKALPVREPERLVLVVHGTGAERDHAYTYPQLAALEKEAKGVIDLIGTSGLHGRLQASGVDREVSIEFANGDYFRALQIQPLLGRLLEPADDVRGSSTATTAVLSYRVWQSEFHGDPSVVGRRVFLNSVPFTVVGVTPRSFFGVDVGSYDDVTTPFASLPFVMPGSNALDSKNSYWLNIIGRLKPGMSTSAAEAGMKVVWKNILPETIWEGFPERYKAEYFRDQIGLEPAATGLSGLRRQFSQPLYVLLAMTGIILLISCANIANLLMARSLARQKELAVRLSIGAKRGRLIRQLLTESALLAAAGLFASVFVYLFCVKGLLRFLDSGGRQVYLDSSPDLRVAAFVGGAALLTLALFGLAPALRATRCRLNEALAGVSQSVTGRSSFGRLILCGQLALSFSLLAAAILLTQSLYDLRTFPAGFRRDHLLLIAPDTERANFKERDQLRFSEAMLAGIRAQPGVRAASASVVIPIEGTSWQRVFTAPGYVAGKGSGYDCYENLVTPDFFRTLGTRLSMGRDLADSDNETGPKIAVVNESFARRYWGKENPLGRQFNELDKKDLITVVGVVEDAKYRDFRKAAPPTVYLPLRQAPTTMGWTPQLAVWTYVDPNSLIGPIKNLLTRQRKDVTATFQTFSEMIDKHLLYERLLTALSIAFGALGMLICAIGIYGVAAYSVSRRTAEIGIRIALGATPDSVMRLIFRDQVVTVALGLSAGAVGAVALTRFLRTWLFGVSPADLPSLAACILSLALLTALATLIPARRAAGIEPMRALHHQ